MEAFALIALALVAGSGGDDAPPSQRDVPDPKRAGADDGYDDIELPPGTVTMRTAPPGPPASSEPDSGSGVVRQTKHNVEVQRSEDEAGNDSGTDKRVMIIELGDVQAVTLRVWIEATFLPAPDAHGSWCAEWRWGGDNVPGTVPRILGPQAIGCPNGTLAWVQLWAAIDIQRRLVVRAMYPGREHSGRYRGARYTLVAEWMGARPEQIVAWD